MKTGPEGVSPGSLYAFAHQAYWGFRYLREHQEPLWLVIKAATSVSEIQKIGEKCSAPNAMPGSGYGAIGAMTWLARDYVAQEVLNAKKHRDYPKSDRPSSEDRRMFFLGIAISAGIFELKLGTALRKLAEADLGSEKLSVDVHRYDLFREKVRTESLIWAESVAHYFWLNANGEWMQLDDLPCEVPKDWHGGYFLYGITDTGLKVVFVRKLPIELEERAPKPRVAVRTKIRRAKSSTPAALPPNHVICKCGATIAAKTREQALKALVEHQKIVHKTRLR
jgi:hypothetical protein